MTFGDPYQRSRFAWDVGSRSELTPSPKGPFSGRVGEANVTRGIFLLISTGENMALAYLHWGIGV